MHVQLITTLISLILKQFGDDLIRDFADMVLDFVEERVLGTASKIDDMTVLPICKLIRAHYEIEDND